MFNKKLNGKKILVADDYEVNTTMLQIFLEEDGATVVVANSGNQCVECVKKEKFDLIFMDVYMPGMSGIDTTKNIRQLSNGKSVPIVGLTGDGADKIIDQCSSAGMNDVIHKPFTPDSILAVCSRLIPVDGNVDESNKNLYISVQGNGEQPLDQSAVFDYKKALSEFSNDAPLLNQVVKKFCESLSSQIENMHQMILGNDWDRVYVEAHTVKGASATLCATALANSAAHLETCIKKKDAEETLRAFSGFRQEATLLLEFVHTLKLEE